jgi:hypothetical protein
LKQQLYFLEFKMTHSWGDIRPKQKRFKIDSVGFEHFWGVFKEVCEMVYVYQKGKEIFTFFFSGPTETPDLCCVFGTPSELRAYHLGVQQSLAKWEGRSTLGGLLEPMKHRPFHAQPHKPSELSHYAPWGAPVPLGDWGVVGRNGSVSTAMPYPKLDSAQELRPEGNSGWHV